MTGHDGLVFVSESQLLKSEVDCWRKLVLLVEVCTVYTASTGQET